MSAGTLPLSLVGRGRGSIALVVSDAEGEFFTCPPDTCCKLAEYDRRCARCITCVLPCCLNDLAPAERVRFWQALRRHVG